MTRADGKTPSASLLDDISRSFDQPSTSDIYSKAEIKVSKSLQETLNTVRVMDIWFQLGSRIVIVLFFLGLLAYQNKIILDLVIEAMRTAKLVDLQVVLGTLMVGTLYETYYILRTLVDWVLNPIDYHE